MGKSAEKVGLARQPSSGDLESSESAMERLKKDINERAHHHGHHHHSKGKSHSKKTEGVKPGLAMFDKVDDKLTPIPSASQSEPEIALLSPNSFNSESEIDLKASHAAKEADAIRKHKANSKAILERRLSELVIKLSELKNKEELIRQKSSKFSLNSGAQSTDPSSNLNITSTPNL